MRSTFLSTLTALSLTAGCSLSDSSSSLESKNEVQPTEECGCKIEGTGIGTEGIYARFGGTIVTLGNWVPKAGSPGEYVGFTMFIDGAPSAGYVVKAGGETYPSHTRTWMHPAGIDGNDLAPAISNVDMCPTCEGGDCGPDTTCQDPDGCPDGGGGGGGTGEDPDGGGSGCDNPDGCPDPTTGEGPFY